MKNIVILVMSCFYGLKIIGINVGFCIQISVVVYREKDLGILGLRVK